MLNIVSVYTNQQMWNIPFSRKFLLMIFPFFRSVSCLFFYLFILWFFFLQYSDILYFLLNTCMSPMSRRHYFKKCQIFIFAGLWKHRRYVVEVRWPSLKQYVWYDIPIPFSLSYMGTTSIPHLYCKLFCAQDLQSRNNEDNVWKLM